MPGRIHKYAVRRDASVGHVEALRRAFQYFMYVIGMLERSRDDLELLRQLPTHLVYIPSP
jgi:hypothetical protein